MLIKYIKLIIIITVGNGGKESEYGKFTNSLLRLIEYILDRRKTTAWSEGATERERRAMPLREIASRFSQKISWMGRCLGSRVKAGVRRRVINDCT
jgi:hypothetical protein